MNNDNTKDINLKDLLDASLYNTKEGYGEMIMFKKDFYYYNPSNKKISDENLKKFKVMKKLKNLKPFTFVNNGKPYVFINHNVPYANMDNYDEFMTIVYHEEHHYLSILNNSNPKIKLRFLYKFIIEIRADNYVVSKGLSKTLYIIRKRILLNTLKNLIKAKGIKRKFNILKSLPLNLVMYLNTLIKKD